MAAEMNNKGQHLRDRQRCTRLAPIHERLTRAGVRNVQVRTPKGKRPAKLNDLAGKCDLVLVDAPCTGAGTWRATRCEMAPRPTRWRCAARSNALCSRAKRYVKPGGRLVYITCSLLDAENGAQVQALLAENPISRWSIPPRMPSCGLESIGQHRDASASASCSRRIARIPTASSFPFHTLHLIAERLA